MRPLLRLAAVALFAAAFAASAGAQAPPPHERTPVPPATFQVSRASSTIEVDGVLDEPAWASATVIPILYEWTPGDNVDPPVKTDCLVTFDERNLYVAFRAHDPEPARIRAHLMDRDSIDTFVQDDHVGVMIDTFNDERRAYQFRVNPLGVQADAIFSEQDGIEDWSWDMIWDSRGRVTDDGYVVEVALPFNQLRFPSTAAVQTWGFAASRSWPRTVRHRMTSHWSDRNKGCVLCEENKIVGLEGLEPGRNLEIDPTVTGTETGERDPFPEGNFDDDRDVEAGVTVRWGITPNLTFSGTANPDFSQVEADVAQLEVNQRFALFYPEKRPFFLEGLDYFATPLPVVFTRTVVDPYGGAKLTGKVGRNALGVFTAVDSLNNLVFPSNQGSDFGSLDADVTTSVVRYRRDVGTRSTVGALVASREGEAYHNRQLGADGFFQFTESDTLAWQALWSSTRYPDETAASYQQPLGQFDGGAITAAYQHVSRSWFWFAQYDDLSPQFRSDTGFVPRVDQRELEGMVGRRFWGDGDGWFTRFDVAMRASRTYDYAGEVTDQRLSPGASYTGPWQSAVEVAIPRETVRYLGVEYDYWRPVVFAELQPSGRVKAGLTVRAGGDVDYDNGRPADSVLIVPSVEMKLGRHVNLQLQHTHQWLDVEGGELFEAGLTELRAVYHFNVRTFVRAILQYTDVTRDPGLYVFPVPYRSERLFSQYLFSFKVNPQTMLFLGYSDTYLGGDTGPSRLALTQSARTLFVKLGYAWLP